MYTHIKRKSLTAQEMNTELNKPIENLSEEKLKLAKKIYTSYIKSGAASEINIGAEIRKILEKKVESDIYTVNMYDDAERVVYIETTVDSFKRFKKSELFKQFLLEYQKNPNRV